MHQYFYFKNIFQATCHSKLEKADILEMTVRYLRSIKSIQGIYPSPTVFADATKTPGHPFGAMRNLENCQMMGASRSQLVAAQIQAAQAHAAAAAISNQLQVAQSHPPRIPPPAQQSVMMTGQPIKTEYFPTGQFNPNLQSKNRNEFKKTKVQNDSFSPIPIDSDSSSSGSTSGTLPVNPVAPTLPIGSKRRHSDISQELSDTSDYDSIDQNNTGLFRPYML